MSGYVRFTAYNLNRIVLRAKGAKAQYVKAKKAVAHPHRQATANGKDLK